jgi:hypothetical protein
VIISNLLWFPFFKILLSSYFKIFVIIVNKRFFKKCDFYFKKNKEKKTR